MKKDKNLDDLFRSKLQNYEQEPPAYLLENILAGAASARQKRKMMFWRVAGVAAAVLLAFVAGWQFNARDEFGTEPQVVVGQQQAIENAVEAVSEKHAAQAATENTLLAAASEPALTAPVKTPSTVQNSNPEKNTILTEPLLVASNDEIRGMNPLKSLFRLLDRENDGANENSLQERKGKAGLQDWVEKTIDQQIMEHNRQLAMAQDKPREKRRWMVGAQVSPAYSVDRSNHSQVYASNMINSSSENPVDLGGGLSVQYKVGKRLSVQSGVYYSGMGQSSGNSSNTVGREYMFADVNRGNEYFNANVAIDAQSSKMLMNSTAGVIEFADVPSGIVLGTNLEDKSFASAVVVSDANFIQNFEYIEIPLYVRYTILDSRFDVEMLGGFSSNVLVGNNTYMESSSGKSLVGSTKDMESLNYSGTLGIGLKYGLSKRVYLNVEPRVKYYLNSLNSNSAVTYKPYTVGVFTGLSYEF